MHSITYCKVLLVCVMGNDGERDRKSDNGEREICVGGFDIPGFRTGGGR